MKISKDLKIRFQKEARAFDKINLERARNNQIPDIRAEFVNEYFYNNFWRNSAFVKQELGPFVAWIISHLNKVNAGSVLELGCGNGFLCLEMARAGFNVTGVDISPKTIKIALDYLKSLKEEREKLRLNYVCGNVLNYKKYSGESVVCFGSLHHLPPTVLKKVVADFSKRMKPGQIMISVEPRYDHVNISMAILIYAIRLALPNYFSYKDPFKNIKKNVTEIFEKITESKKTQSEMDNESSSDMILSAIKNNFSRIDVGGCSSFSDKVVGSVRVDDVDSRDLAHMLKQFDEMILKYRPDYHQLIKVVAYKE